MIVYDIHLILDESEDIASMPQDLLDKFDELSAEFPKSPALSTQIYNNKKVLHARIQYNGLTEQILQGLLDSFGLNWAILGIREAYNTIITDGNGDVVSDDYTVIKAIQKSTILPYLINQDEPIYLPMYSGTEPIQL